jgi:tetratricopeptide (TPR) repeat protein
MGVVYEAEQTDPVRRRVALKVMRAGLDPGQIVSRFEAERQALAVMSHPGIAKVLDAGTTESGLPYFVMELVKGLPITEYCDTRTLPTRERLELFMSVCQAVQHAHQKGVIHRDLKPSNVLVAEHDGVPEVKIIDFGIAKAIGLQLTEKTLVTELGQTMGTAAYMSPEQAEASGLDVDTRADIYSLGVLLYEILVGQLPVDPATLGVHAFLALLVVRETNPPTPSARLHSLGPRREQIALSRRTSAVHLRRQLRGDLDWIVMKAMEPDRTRRYETASALAADLRHYLAAEPVSARPPSGAYRLGKFVRRHRAGVAAGVVAVLALALGATFATVGMMRATRAQRSATQEAAAARQVTDFLVGLFRVSDPGEARGGSVTARELLDSGAQRVSQQLAGQPALQGRIMHTMGTVYTALGLYAEAGPLLEDALRVREHALGPDDPAVAETLVALGDVARERGDYAAADRYYARALSIRQTALGPDDETVAGTLYSIAVLRFRQGRNAEAESLYTRVLAVDERALASDDTLRARHLMGLAVVYWSQGRYAEVAPLLQRTLDIQERSLGKDHPAVAATLNNLGALYWTEGRYADALPLYERTRAIWERTLGPNHPDVAAVLNNLAETYWKLRRFDEAEPLFRRSLAIKERILLPTHPDIAVTLNSLAGLLRDEGRYREAEPLYRRALAIRTRAFGENSDVAETLRDYAVLLRRTGRAGEAAALEARAARTK